MTATALATHPPIPGHDPSGRTINQVYEFSSPEGGLFSRCTGPTSTTASNEPTRGKRGVGETKARLGPPQSAPRRSAQWARLGQRPKDLVAPRATLIHR